MTMRGGGTLLVAGLVLIAATACGGAVGSAAPKAPAAPGATTRPEAVTSAPAPKSGTPSRAGRPAPSRRPTPSRTAAAAAPAPACAARDLTASEAQGAGGGSGWFFTPIQLRNHSGSACRLRGWPGLVFYGDGTIKACGPGDHSPSCGKPLSRTEPRSFSVARSPARTLPDVSLAPGDTTTFTLVWKGSYSCDTYVTPPYGIAVRVPGDSRALTVIPTVAISPCDEYLEVTAFGLTA
ncbi:DUF4232 domain-containing protein [Streptomyces olivochromogenes]|uniref:DUF4232 domain-containing protein n=1 Tax=Streptomyces olivochromogenes TaxID=1963 RepID=UPI001F351583|nr:DUF4232 domain-containing protein [Streptomyces olivochromogenes]MCF3129460.1 DUF4232 domain-containing protein [Streptomyces olivochromogenes]